ncbi:hypothetical protein BD626DRAFT_501208 [Schizophyllum amplum]|uniref:Uncharacterized protein n=1 Tax=Schizophyllum amplum TaxID=97359 RepID=A0A550C9N0_9AGAR|nr:hypothetical protein BD626DRAFT_501208 [Auriculariopsis ampla]
MCHRIAKRQFARRTPPRRWIEDSEPKNKKADFWKTSHSFGIRKFRYASLTAHEQKINERSSRRDPYKDFSLTTHGLLRCDDECTMVNVIRDMTKLDRAERRARAQERRRQKQQTKYNALVEKIARMDITGLPHSRHSSPVPSMSSDESTSCYASSESTSDSESDGSMPATPREGSLEPEVVQAMNDLHVATHDELIIESLNDSIFQLDVAPKAPPRRSPSPISRGNRAARKAISPYAASVARRRRAVIEDKVPEDVPLPTENDVAFAGDRLRQRILKADRAIRNANKALQSVEIMAKIAFRRQHHGELPPPGSEVEPALAPRRVVLEARRLANAALDRRVECEKQLSFYSLACHYGGLEVDEELVRRAEELAVRKA